MDLASAILNKEPFDEERLMDLQDRDSLSISFLRSWWILGKITLAGSFITINLKGISLGNG